MNKFTIVIIVAAICILVKGEDYYKILGIPKTATDKEIKH